MANKTEASQGTLQRGKACLRCRKRKMRCDGMRPACQQCTRAKKGEGCEYDDGKGKTRTQLLRETITRLEDRIRQLEDPEYISPAVTLYDPHHSHHHSESSSSSLGSPSIAASHSPFPSGSASPPHETWLSISSPHPTSSSPDPSIFQGSPVHPPFTADIFFEDPQFQSPLFELGPMLLDIFSPHRHQCGLEIHLGRLRESLNQPLSEQPHPALMNAIYLWACFVSRPEPLSQHEAHFLNQALDAHRDGLRNQSKIVDIIRASCLLSIYFFSNDRVLEGSYHASAAAALAVQCGLHAGLSTSPMSSWLPESPEAKPHKTDYREGERILAFWQVYNLDRCWSVALRKPTVIPDGPEAWNSIHCPWPQDISEYEAGHINSGSFQTISSFFEGDVSPEGFSTQALRAKASALFARAEQVSACWDPSSKPSVRSQEQIQTLELAITRFIPTLVPVHQLDTTPLLGDTDKHTYIVAHSLAHAAVIHLYQRFALDDPVAYDKCSRAASACVGIVKCIGDRDYDYLDPIIGTCWTSAADILIRDLNNLEAAWPALVPRTTEVKSDLGTMLYAMTCLGVKFPILRGPAGKISQRLSEA
ncbi:hypothetical protein C8J56DRAFT_90526 [Mycena floridula]|nr:hypothetical protein C8J56DRAFT_90526 [Mycena floridula]